MKLKKSLLALPLAVLLLGGCAQQVSQADYIGIDAAKAAALEAAGVSAADASFTTAGLDKRNGVDFYAVDFTAGGQDYEYDIDAVTGVIISSSTPNTQIEDSAASSTPRPETTQSDAGSGTDIGADRAKEIALTHAGLTAADVTFVKCHLDRDDGRQVYDVEFYTADYQEYDYEIDPYTGDILAYDYDADYYTSPTGNGSGITQEEAQNIALAKVPGATANDIYEFSVDYDDGRLEYEVEFYSGSTEYDYEIDAATGDILSYDNDVENFSIPQQQGTATGSYIGEDAAKAAALQRAGLTEDQVRWEKCELDEDDGRYFWEGDATLNGSRYEFAIDAVTGTMVEWERD